MDEQEWTKVCREDELKEGVPKLVKLGDKEVLLLRLGDGLHAIGNTCPHYECPLNEGTVLGKELVCACHHARFDVVTGRLLSPPALNDLPLYPLRVEQGEVFLGPVRKARFPKAPGSDSRNFLLVGAGAAGNAAAEALRREGFSGRILMLSAETDLPYDRPNLSKEFMSGEAQSEWMTLRSEKFYAAQGIELLLGTKVASLDPRAKNVKLEDGRVLGFDKALLATGSRARRLEVPGAEGEACFALRSFADARAIVEAAQSASRAVIIGAGFIGMELASSLRTRGLAVELVDPGSLPFSRLFGERVARYLKKRHEDRSVVFHLGTQVVGISGAAGSKLIELSTGERLAADFVVYGVGARSVVDYLAGTELVEDGAVPVDLRLQTRHPDIFAAGDLALVRDSAGGKTRIEHWVVAERQGRHAARAMLGSSELYEEAPFFWTRQTEVSLKYLGFAPEWDEIVYRGEVEEGRFIAGFYRRGRLLAAAGMEESAQLAALENLLSRHLPLPSEKLGDGSFDLRSLVSA